MKKTKDKKKGKSKKLSECDKVNKYLKNFLHFMEIRLFGLLNKF
jgi:hypothetical protein